MGARTFLFVIDGHQSEVVDSESVRNRFQTLSGVHVSSFLIGAQVLLQYDSFVVLHGGSRSYLKKEFLSD
jgi:hypothetical protein